MTESKAKKQTERFLDTLLEIYTECQLEMVARSFSLLDKQERKRRLKAIIQLSIELGKIRDVDLHATGLGEIAIEDLIEGDLKGVADWATHFQFDDEGRDYMDRHASLWANFRELLRAAATPQKDIQ